MLSGHQCIPIFHDDVITWKHFPRYWPFLRSPVNSPHKGQWRGALMFSLICARINSWVNTGEAGYLRRHRGHYDVIVMFTRNWQRPTTTEVPRSSRYVVDNPSSSSVVKLFYKYVYLRHLGTLLKQETHTWTQILLKTIFFINWVLDGRCYWNITFDTCCNVQVLAHIVTYKITISFHIQK